MIVAAGLSPAWQQIVVLDQLEPGEVNRAREVHWCASGKVLNVGLAVKSLCTLPALRNSEGLAPGNSPCSRTVALVGGETGEAIRHEFVSLGVSARWVHSASPTRVCTTILARRQGITTELVENAREISSADLLRFREAFHEEAAQASVVVLTGSFPAGTPAGFYREIMERAPWPAIVDAQGEPLLEAVAAHPFVVKPNREELGRTLNLPVDTDEALHAAMRILNERGARWVVVSQGKGRVWVRSRERLVAIDPPAVEAVNPIGSGDCLAAGIAVGIAAGYDLPEAVELGVAAAAENVGHLLPARIDPAKTCELLASWKEGRTTLARPPER